MNAPREFPAPGVTVGAVDDDGEGVVALVATPGCRLTAWDAVRVAAALLRAATASGSIR